MYQNASPFFAFNDTSVWRDLFVVTSVGPAIVVAVELSFSVGYVSDIRQGIVETIVSAMSSMMSYVGVPVRKEMTVGINNEKQKQVDVCHKKQWCMLALQERVGGWEWADMMVVDFIRELEAVLGVAAAVKTAEFLNDPLCKDDRRIQRLWKL
ncbi:hypothetical protein Tco_0914834 [Tanacetum coccineum]